MIDLSIIILSFNTKNLLDECLQSLGNLPNNFELIVVDNASTDGTISMIKRKYPQINLIENRKNLGYSAGNNLGVSRARGENILLLNSDTKVIGDSLNVMIECLNEHKDIGILGSRLINPDGTIQKSVGTFYSLANVALMLCGGERVGFLRSSPEKFSLVDWVSGSCFLVRKMVWEKIGALDENLFMYLEEVEFCFRAKQKGILTAFTPKAKVVHLGLGSAKKGRQEAILNIYKGLVYFYQKYYSERKQKILKLLLRTKAITAKVIGKISGNRELVNTYDKAYRLVV